MGTDKQTGVGVGSNGKKRLRGGGYREDIRWLHEFEDRRKKEADAERMERQRRLAERDAEYAKAFPHLVRRTRMVHDVYNDPMADLRRRCVG